MAKSKPIGVRFDEDVIKAIRERYPAFVTYQSILNFLMTIYPAYENMKALTRHELVKNMDIRPELDVSDTKSDTSTIYHKEPVELTLNAKLEPPKNLTGIDLSIWKSENWK